MKTALRAALSRAVLNFAVLSAGLVSGIAWAAGERNPFDYSVLTYLWVLGVSAMGGVVNFSRKMREGQTRAFNVTEFLGELVTSAFAGLLTFWLCESANIDRLVAAVMIAVSGHMGSRAIFGFEKWMEARSGVSADTKQVRR